jgi:hypothetical protein
LDRTKERVDLCLTADQASLLSLLRERGRILAETYEGDRIRVTARVTPKLAGQLRKVVNGSSRLRARRQREAE